MGMVVNPSTRVGKSGRGRLALGYARGLLRVGHNEREESYGNTLTQYSYRNRASHERSCCFTGALGRSGPVGTAAFATFSS